MPHPTHEVAAGERVVCELCNGSQPAGPSTADWRCVEAEGRRFFFCPGEFPPDTNPRAYARAYARALAVLKRRYGIEVEP